MRRIGSVLTVAFVLVFFSSHATAAGGNFISREQVHLVKLYAPPPADYSPQARSKLDELVQVQRKSTPQALAEAEAGAKESIFQLAGILGPRFTSDALPITATRFVERLGEDEGYIVSPEKEAWKRPPSFRLNTEIEPRLSAPSGAAYPSDHATYGYLNTIVPTNMLPEREVEILDRAVQCVRNRVVCGVHFPGDVEACRIAWTVIAAFALQNSAFQEEYAKAKAEVRKALGYD
jgi:acid phosphatase (class A)